MKCLIWFQKYYEMFDLAQNYYEMFDLVQNIRKGISQCHLQAKSCRTHDSSTNYFACFESLCPSQQFFSHVATVSFLPGLNHY